MKQISGLSTTNIKFDSQTGVISWPSNTDSGEYGFKVSAYDIVSGRVKAYNHQADFTLIVRVKPISEFSYPQTSRVLFYKNSGRSQKPRLNRGVGITDAFSLELTSKDEVAIPSEINLSPEGFLEITKEGEKSIFL